MAKKDKPAKPYLVKKASPPRKEPTPQHEHQCMWGCGYSAGNMTAVRSHEAGCDRKK